MRRPQHEASFRFPTAAFRRGGRFERLLAQFFGQRKCELVDGAEQLFATDDVRGALSGEVEPLDFTLVGVV